MDLVAAIPWWLVVVVVLALFAWGEVRLRQLARLRQSGQLKYRPPMFKLMFAPVSTLLRDDARRRTRTE